MKTADAFPVAISSSDEAECYQFSEDELHALESQPYKSGGDHGMTEDLQVLNQPKLSGIKKFVEDGIEDYVRNVLLISEEVKFKISSSWANIQEVGNTHHMHFHTNSVISGVLHVSDGNILVFCDGSNDRYNHWSFPFKGGNQYNTREAGFKFKKGCLVLFPSTVKHYVPPYEKINKQKDDEPEITFESMSSFNHGNRISISFNVFLDGPVMPGTTEQLDL